MKRSAVTLLLVAMVLISGCSGLLEQSTPTESGELSQTVQLPNGGVAGEESVVEIELNNTGSEERQYNATLTADGETVDEGSVTVAGGNSTTLSLSHTFEETGEHTLSVANESTNITVYETPTAFVTAQEDAVETVSYEQETTGDAVVNYNGESVDSEIDGTVTVRKNFTAETMYESGTERTTTRDQTSTESVETWIVDGTEYTKSVDEDSGETSYDREFADEFEDDDIELDNEAIQPYLSTAHTDEEYVFVLEADTSAEASDLWATISSLRGGGSDIFTAEEMDSLRFELRYDRQTGRQTGEVADVSASGGETFAEFDMTITKSSYSYGETVSVEVPQEVKDNA